MTLEFHPLANLFPLIEGDEFDALVAGMKTDGFRSGEEIILYEGKILDGRNRYRAALAAGIVDEDDSPKNCLLFSEFARESNVWFSEAELDAGPLAYVLSKNLHRRHLNESQRATVAARLANMRQGERTDLEPANLPEVRVSQADAAKTLAISERSVRHAKIVLDEGSPELVAAVEQGKIAVSLAAQAATFSPAMQQLVVDEATAGRANAVRTVVKREARAEKEKALAARQMALPDKRYGVIYADPEWRFEPRSRDTGMDRSPDNHYPTSPTAEIASRDVPSIAAADCALFLWATPPMIEDALLVLNAWGFKYCSQLIWVKERPGEQRGPGYWFTAEHEILLVGTRGNIPAPALGTQSRSVITAPVGEHSEKPTKVYEIIESYYPSLPKIELNARDARAGWESWGFEAPENVSCETFATANYNTTPDARTMEVLPWPEAVVSKTLEWLDSELPTMPVVVAGVREEAALPQLPRIDEFDADRDMPAFLRRIK